MGLDGFGDWKCRFEGCLRCSNHGDCGCIPQFSMRRCILHDLGGSVGRIGRDLMVSTMDFKVAQDLIDGKKCGR